MSSDKDRAFEKGVRGASNILNFIGMGMLLALMLLGAADVIGRYFFSRPITGTFEIGQVLVASMVFFSWGYTQLAREHVRVDIFISRLNPRSQAITDFVAIFMSMLLFGIMAWQGVLVTKLYFEGGRLISDVIGWPLFIFQSFIPIGAVAICLVFNTQMIQLLPRMKRGG